MKKIRSTHLHTTIVVVVMLILLIAVFLVFRHYLNATLRETEEAHLVENANTVSEVFYTKLDDQLTMLESQARYFRTIDLSDYNSMKRTILSTKGIGGFKNIGVANSSGATINYNGTSSGNIYLSGYYREAMQGHNAISESTIIDEDGDEVLVLAVPIIKDGTAAGVIYGTFTTDTIDSIIDSISMSKTTSNIVVSSEGKILAHSTFGGNDEQSSDLKDFIPRQKMPANEKARTLYVERHDKNYIAEIVPIGLHDWYFITILPETTVTDLTTEITVYVGFAVGSVLTIFLIILLLIARLLRKADIISERASTDSLTRILNKGTFRTRFCEEMDKGKSGLAMFIIDLDDFKSVNDNLGHVMGDKVLVDTADKLSEIFGSRESVGRIGGDEFSAFLRCGGNIETVEKTAEKICTEMNKEYTAHGASVSVSVSVGIALYPASGRDYEELYRNADSALYKVKGSGKNMYALYSGEEQENE
ncbi:diguanylate cyclase (GGDEF) domain-containing protein [Ruminococcus sp. YE71]|uniref:sensor domain-containing diguanylate cyclase n=1 Tax=unclassified Ruminococcus TaxID=2608920 RepID=UPI0008881005|nr:MULTISPECIES: sensor domain-containing diguanylate cyclase [unclassified Ruminococcus]SDA20657.1 diguanylate cyclase (GGDEF) domain-containing protein [Ruminococcus sp. YE78]SFW33857.1 diguanylate cyclase (GGDEF) domain-containing protein [Ruminococcus sp. YE71]